MEKISSRKNRIICHMRAVASDPAYRSEVGQFICDGEKTLREALEYGAEIVQVLWREGAHTEELPAEIEQYCAPADLVEYASSLKSGPGPVFTVKIPQQSRDERIMRAIVIETLQDPGNVGTIIRSANAFDIDAVIMVGACADLYNPKTVRASMGAIFRQRVLKMSIKELDEFTRRQCLPLFGAALSDKAADIRNAELHRSAVAIGSEGRGLSLELLDICGGELIIPMNSHSESLNAAIAASVIMWEMSR